MALASIKRRLGELRRYKHARLRRYGTSVQVRGLRGEYIASKWKWSRYYEAKLLDFIYKSYGRGGTYIDVGANIGNHTLYFAAVCRADRVIACEPDPLNFELLNYNLEMNQLDHVEAMQCALSERAGVCSITQLDDTNRGMGQIRIGSTGNIPVRTLDSLTNEPIKLIKIDVEGHGIPVLKGAKGILEKRQTVIAVEIAPEPLEPFEELLLPLGYRTVGRFNYTPTYVFEPA